MADFLSSLKLYYDSIYNELKYLSFGFVEDKEAGTNFITVRSTGSGNLLAVINLLKDNKFEKEDSICGLELLTDPGLNIVFDNEIAFSEGGVLLLYLYLRDAFSLEYNLELDCLEKVVYISDADLLPLDKFLGITFTSSGISKSRTSAYISFNFNADILNTYTYDTKYNISSPIKRYKGFRGSYHVAIPWSTEVLEYYINTCFDNRAKNLNTGRGKFQKEVKIKDTRL